MKARELDEIEVRGTKLSGVTRVLGRAPKLSFSAVSVVLGRGGSAEMMETRIDRDGPGRTRNSKKQRASEVRCSLAGPRIRVDVPPRPADVTGRPWRMRFVGHCA